MTLKHTPCDCAEWRRLNEACADLLRKRDQLKKLIAEKDAQLGKRLCQYTRCIQFANLQAERDEWKRLFTLNANDERTVKDAERYRFIRRYMVRVIDVDSSGFVTTRVIDYEKSDDLDAAIDAAMQEAPNA